MYGRALGVFCLAAQDRFECDPGLSGALNYKQGIWKHRRMTLLRTLFHDVLLQDKVIQFSLWFLLVKGLWFLMRKGSNNRALGAVLGF